MGKSMGCNWRKWITYTLAFVAAIVAAVALSVVPPYFVERELFQRLSSTEYAERVAAFHAIAHRGSERCIALVLVETRKLSVPVPPDTVRIQVDRVSRYVGNSRSGMITLSGFLELSLLRVPVGGKGLIWCGETAMGMQECLEANGAEAIEIAIGKCLSGEAMAEPDRYLFSG